MPPLRAIYSTSPVALQSRSRLSRALAICYVIGLATLLAGLLTQTALAQRSPFSGRPVYRPAPSRYTIPRTPPMDWEEDYYDEVPSRGRVPVASGSRAPAQRVGFAEQTDSWAVEGASCGPSAADCDIYETPDWDYTWPVRPFWTNWWVRAEYLLWWTEGFDVPPLVTTSPLGTPSNTAGVLGYSSTSVLFGGLVNTDLNSGGRISFGHWFSPCQQWALEGSYLGIGRETTRFRGDSTDTPILARPYVDLSENTQAALLAAYPNLWSGSLAVDAFSELQTAEAMLRRRLIDDCHQTLDFVAGYRFARLYEGLWIGQTSRWLSQQGPWVQNTTVSISDRFVTDNQFHGAQVGFVFQERVGRWTLEMLAKLALGANYGELSVDGSTTVSVPGGGTTIYSGGLLAQETNEGLHTRNELAFIPELGMTVGFDITCRLRATVGYTFLYWSRVVRPGGVVDLDASQLPPEEPAGLRRPAVRFVADDYWAQGINLGLDYRF